MDFGNIINNLLNQMAFFHLGAGNYVMIVVALVFLDLAIRKERCIRDRSWTFPAVTSKSMT